MITIKFYTTDTCTLCDEALSIVKVCINKAHHRLDFIDIADSDELIEQYGCKIPVLSREDVNTRLFWPFSPGDVQNFLL